MRVLNQDELQAAEGVLLKHLPKSVQIYGFLYGINNAFPSALQVIVDRWPDFKVIVCRTPPEYEGDQVFIRAVPFYSTDDQSLRKMLMEGNGLDWTSTLTIGAFDACQLHIVEEVSSAKAVSSRRCVLGHVLYLPDSSHLIPAAVDRELESRISPLNLSHVDLVNQISKFRGSKRGFRYVQHLICNFPTYGLTDARGQLLSWILLHDFFGFGFLYTLPEHRRRGYGKAVVSAMAKRLVAEGRPVYTFIDEGNVASYRLFKSLGFIEDPSYRVAWVDFNF
ncbi:glycine N-acyltransferase-like protein 3 [Antennarius striatus]|uniref:glycine N-acyltransferase-like protein 3 n=1 Tax=Antennarius striatus TaxID=241820 RepID=UPI0035B2FCB0